MPAPVRTKTRSDGAMEMDMMTAFTYQLPLRHQQNLACGLALFEINLSPGRFSERVGVLGAELEFAIGRPVEHFVCTPLELGARGNVMPERGPSEKERSFAVEQAGIEGRNGAAGGAKQCQQTARVQTIEAALESSFTHRVVDHVDALAAREALDLGLEILVGVENHVGGSSLARKLGLGLGGDGGDNARPDVRGHLRKQQAHAA